MRISVRSRPGKAGSEPCSLCLGGARLHVTGILEHSKLADGHRFQVRVSDGRRLVLLHTPADRWELHGVYASAPYPGKEKPGLPGRALRYRRLTSVSATRRGG